MERREGSSWQKGIDEEESRMIVSLIPNASAFASLTISLSRAGNQREDDIPCSSCESEGGRSIGRLNEVDPGEEEEVSFCLENRKVLGDAIQSPSTWGRRQQIEGRREEANLQAGQLKDDPQQISLSTPVVAFRGRSR